jgi:copper chaperone
MTERTYRVEGVTCDHCVQTVSSEVGKVDGVQDVDVQLATGEVTVTGETVDDTAIRSAIKEAGYEVVAGGPSR